MIAYKAHQTTLEDTLLFSCQRPDQITENPRRLNGNPNFSSRPKLALLCIVRDRIFIVNWWSGPGLNRQPSACKADALPIELPPQTLLTDPLTLEPRAALHVSSLTALMKYWWAQEESNFRPRPYQGRALAS